MPAATTTAPAPAPAAPPHLVRVGPAIPAQAPSPAREAVRPPAAVIPLTAPEAAPDTAPVTVIRVERGAATPEEIAAVTAVLLARAAAVDAAADAARAAASRHRAAARWRAHAFAGPRAWTTPTPGLLAG
ncbi:acyl-CoA carboxylase epsilon subunit [Streptomyces sp. NPDC051976]|uniref:acyl-CoA carboxylase epsilon subunit n=1 Tax=Streptomyces sp. NPDC051976 TaxID=3154947 RepID=UPI00343FDF5E